MWIHRLNRILWVTLTVSLLAGLYLSRKPLCIDSKAVERLDRIDISGAVETTWSCSFGKDVPWSQTLFRRMPSWERRLGPVEEALNLIEPFKKPLHVVILTERPWAFRLADGTLFIGDRLIESQGHFERAIVKAWLAERESEFEGGDIASEVMTDFVFGMVTGSLILEDAEHALRTRSGARWPLTLKDAKSYCDSPWKLSEHFELCGQNSSILSDRVWKLSLRPVLSSSILSAWWDMPLTDRLEFYRRIPEWLRNGSAVVVDTGKEGPQSAVMSIHAFQKMIASRDMAFASAAILTKSLETHLRQSGFAETDDRVSFDILVLSDFPLETSSDFFQQLTAFAISHPTMKIAAKDPSGLTLLPTHGRLKINDMADLKASRVAVLRCGRFDFDWVLSFDGIAQRLFVVDSCGSKLPDLPSWMANDAEGFAKANKDFRFIQFHLPSLAARKQNLNRAMDVLTVVQKRDVADPVFQTLGWRELNWSQSANAYHPRAQIDAIEWFRLN